MYTKENLINLTDIELIEIANDILGNDMIDDYKIYPMEQFDNYCSKHHITPFDIATGYVLNKDFDHLDDWFYSNGGDGTDITSFTDLADKKESMVDYIVKYQEEA